MNATYSKSWLTTAYPNWEEIPWCFFWGHQPAADGSTTKSCFSQWWVAPFEVDGVVYKTAEHWMMAGKAHLFSDEAAFQNVLSAETPAKAKEVGRTVKNFDPAIWDEHKYELVVTGNLHKFSAHPALTEFLLGIGNQVLVEASPVDAIWGIGLEASNPAAKNPSLWRGDNLLGFALMEVRDQLKKK